MTWSFRASCNLPFLLRTSIRGLLKTSSRVNSSSRAQSRDLRGVSYSRRSCALRPGQLASTNRLVAREAPARLDAILRIDSSAPLGMTAFVVFGYLESRSSLPSLHRACPAFPEHSRRTPHNDNLFYGWSQELDDRAMSHGRSASSTDSSRGGDG